MNQRAARIDGGQGDEGTERQRQIPDAAQAVKTCAQSRFAVYPEYYDYGGRGIELMTALPTGGCGMDRGLQ